MNETGLLLIGHGSNDSRGIAEFLQVVEQTRSLAGRMPVEPGFLELASPTIVDGTERLAAKGVDHIVAVPVLLFSAGHVKVDIPRVLDQARRDISATYEVDLRISQAQHLGCHDRIVDLSAARCLDSLDHNLRSQQGKVAHVMVGRGSNDEAATREFYEFARICQTRTGSSRSEVCFMAMAEPRFETTLKELAKSGTQHVVVQPHLLFEGRLLDRLRTTVESLQREFPTSAWQLTRHLGPDSRLAEAITDRAMASAHERPRASRARV